MIDNDDAPIGHVLSRREVLALLGATALAACAPGATPSPAPTAAVATGVVGVTATPLAATPAGTTPAPAATTGGVAAVPSCIVRPALSEGPFFVDTKLDRSDIRETRPGIPLTLAFNVSRVTGGQCRVLQGAVVDVWHCDAAGVYSDVEAASRGQKWLRGLQTTDGGGVARFTTIYPGWYPGRAVHIHFKIRTSEAGRTSDFTSQLFFDDTVNDEVFAQPPYAQRTGSRPRNESDGIFRNSGGKLTLNVTRTGSSYTATFDIAFS